MLSLSFISYATQDQFIQVRYALYRSPDRGQERSTCMSEFLEASRRVQIPRRSNRMVLSLVIASVLGTLWAWMVWIVVGGLAGALADRLIQGDELGIVGNIVVGIVGGVIGGAILGLFTLDGGGISCTFFLAML